MILVKIRSEFELNQIWTKIVWSQLKSKMSSYNYAYEEEYLEYKNRNYRRTKKFEFKSNKLSLSPNELNLSWFEYSILSQLGLNPYSLFTSQVQILICRF